MPELSIYKYVLEPDFGVMRIPHGGRILSCGEQDGRVVVWAEVDPDQLPAQRRVIGVETGGHVPDGMRFVGTVQIKGRIAKFEYVIHIYEGEISDAD